MIYQIFKTPQPYQKILNLQESLREKVFTDENFKGAILLLEHTPCYTLGIRGKENNILVNENFLKTKGIEIYHIKRGGDITYHGPGQLVIYIIAHIKKAGFSSIKEFTKWWAERILSAIKNEFKIEAFWDDEHPGLWTKNGKIMATGLHFSKFVSTHGFALNINPDMENFMGINPCGDVGGKVTSLYKETGKTFTHTEVAELIINNISEIKETEKGEFI